jgi:hypothetical protein
MQEFFLSAYEGDFSGEQQESQAIALFDEKPFFFP